MAIVSAREQLGIGSGASVAIGSLQSLPVDAGSFTASETVEQILDTGRRGAEAMDYGAYSGVKSTEISFDFPMMYGNPTLAAGNTGSVLGILLKSLLGITAGTNATDTLKQTDAGSSTGNYNNYFRLGTTKNYITIARRLLAHGSGNTDQDVRYTSARCNEITISGNAGEGFVTCSASLTSKAALTDDMSSLTNGNFKTATLSSDIQRGWENIAVLTYPQKIAGVTVTNLISWEVTLSRAASPIYTAANSQDYNDLYLGPLEVTFSAVASVPDNALIALHRAGTQGETQFAASMGHATHSNVGCRALVIGLKKSVLTEAPLELDTSGDYVTISLSGRGLANNLAQSLIPSGDTFTTATNVNQVTPVEILIKEKGVNASGSVPTY